MTRNEITIKVQAAINTVLAEHHSDKAVVTLTGDTHLAENLGFDSLDGMSLGIELEDIFSIELSATHEQKFPGLTIREIVEYVEARL